MVTFLLSKLFPPFKWWQIKFGNKLENKSCSASSGGGVVVTSQHEPL